MRKILLLLVCAMAMGSLTASAIDWSTEGLNVAQGKTSWASSGTPESGNDGNEGTRWESLHFAPQWWCVDLGSEIDVDRIEIKWEAAYASSYQLYVLENEPAYTSVTEEVTDPAGQEFTFNKLNDGQLGTPFATSEQYPVTDLYTTISDLENVKARYILIYCSERALQYGISFFEFRVSEKIADANVVTSISVSDAKVKQNVPYTFQVSSLNRVGAPVSESVEGATFTYAPSDGSITVTPKGAEGYELTATQFGTYTLTTEVTIDGQTLTTTSNLEVGPDWDTLRNVACSKVNLLAKAYASHNSATAYLSNDGDTGTRWGGDAGPCWWFVDLGNTYAISVVEAEFETAGAEDWEVYVATEANISEVDGQTVVEPVWGETPVASVTGLPSQNHLVSTLVTNNVSARYVKFNFSKANTGWAVSPYELRVAGTPDHEEVPGSVALTVSATEISASEQVTVTAKVVGDYGTEIDSPVTYELRNNTSNAQLSAEGILTTTQKGSVEIVAKAGEISSDPVKVTTIAAGDDLAQVSKGATAIANGTEDASNLIDGDDGTMYVFANGGDNEQEHTVVIDLHRLVDIDMVRVHMEGASSANYTIDYSADGTNFTTKYSYQGPDGVNGYTHTYYGAEGSTGVRYLRLHSTRNATGYGLKIYEISVFGETYLERSGSEFSGKWSESDFLAQISESDAYVDLTNVTDLPQTKPAVADMPNLLIVVGENAAFKGDSNVVVKDAQGNYTAALIDLYNTADYTPSITVNAGRINVHVDYKQTDGYAEIYLPFEFYSVDNRPLYTFESVDGEGNVYLSSAATSYAAYTPFVMSLQSNMTLLYVENRVLNPAEAGSAAAAELTPISMKGTFSAVQPYGENAYKVNGGQLRAVQEGDTVNAFSNYTVIEGVTKDYTILEQTETGVESIAEGTTLVDVYSLEGVQLKSGIAIKDATVGLNPGIYVVGGKKVLVRK